MAKPITKKITVFSLAFLSLIFLSSKIYSYESWIGQAYLSSYNYEKMGNYKDAIKAIMPVYNEYPKSYTPNLRLGWLYYLNKNYNNSITHYKSSILAAPYSLKAKNYLCLVYITQTKFDEAEKLAYQVIKTDYYNYYGNIYLTSALLGQKKHDLAEKTITKMLIIDPTSIVFLEKLVLVYQFQKDTKKVNATLDDILILDPNNVFANSLVNKKEKKK